MAVEDPLDDEPLDREDEVELLVELDRDFEVELEPGRFAADSVVLVSLSSSASLAELA